MEPIQLQDASFLHIMHQHMHQVPNHTADAYGDSPFKPDDDDDDDDKAVDLFAELNNDPELTAVLLSTALPAQNRLPNRALGCYQKKITLHKRQLLDIIPWETAGYTRTFDYYPKAPVFDVWFGGVI